MAVTTEMLSTAGETDTNRWVQAPGYQQEGPGAHILSGPAFVKYF